MDFYLYQEKNNMPQQIWEYDTMTINQEELFTTLTEKGKECWELCNMFPGQKAEPSKIIGQQPKVTNVWILIFKR
jgi:hypothetical protein